MARKVRIVLFANLVMFSITGLLAEVGFRLFWHHGAGRMQRIGLSARAKTGRGEMVAEVGVSDGEQGVSRAIPHARGYRARPNRRRRAIPTALPSWATPLPKRNRSTMTRPSWPYSNAGLRDGRVTTHPRARITAFPEPVSSTIGSGLPTTFSAGVEPPAIVLCIYPSNDFLDYCPDDGFEPDDSPKREYFGEPTWTRHVVTWLILKSKLASYVDYAVQDERNR